MAWFDIVILILIGLAFFEGFKSGFMLQLASLVGLIAAFIFAGDGVAYLYPKLMITTAMPEQWALILSYIISFLLILLVFKLVGVVLKFTTKLILLGGADRIVGGVFSVLTSLIVIGFLLNLLALADKEHTIIKKEVQDSSHFYPLLITSTKPLLSLVDGSILDYLSALPQSTEEVRQSLPTIDL